MAATLRLSGDTEDKLKLISQIMGISKHKIIEHAVEDKVDDIIKSDEFKAKLEEFFDQFNGIMTPILETLRLNNDRRK